MHHHTESSVLFSLRELQKIEEDRLHEEQVAEQHARDEAQRARTADAERQRQIEVDRLRAAEEAASRALEDRERQQHMERLHLEEAELRARIEAAAELESQRLALESELHRMERARKRPMRILSAVWVAALAIGLGVYMQRNAHHVEADTIAAAQHATMVHQLDEEALAVEANVESELAEMDQKFQALQATLEADEARNAREAREAQAQATELAKVRRAKELAAKKAKEARLERLAEERQRREYERCIRSGQPLCGM